jgi:prepilin-type N-terminal cleavage/methylation domain-containing protein
MNKSSNLGFTLIELLVAMAIISVLGLGLISLQYILGQNQVLVWNNYISIDDTNEAISQMTREVRTARYGDNGAFPLIGAFDQELIFFSNVDDDAGTERVRYFLTDTTLYKGVIDPAGYPVTYPSANEKLFPISEIVRNGTTPVFYYYNGDWPEDTVNNPLPAPVRLSESKTIKLYLRLNAKPDDPEGDYILEPYVQIRMVKENL